MEGFVGGANIDRYDAVISNGLFECRVFWARIIRSECENPLTNYTRHTFWEIEYALEGKFSFMTEANPCMIIEEGDFFIVPPDTFHQVVDGESAASRFIMAFSITGKTNEASVRIDGMKRAPMLKATPNMRAIVMMLAEKESPDTAIRKKIRIALSECLMLEIIDAVGPLSAAEQSLDRARGDSLSDAVCEYIREYNGIGITVGDLASRFALSERHLNRVVTAATGRTPGEIIGHEKLRKIEELITTTGLSFGEIATLCGFYDEYSMNRFFKKNSNLTVSQFKKIAASRGKESMKNA